jgi:hypothetical protein
MLDGVSLDQLRTFIAAAEEGEIPLRLHVETWAAVAGVVLDRRCAIGLISSLPPTPRQFSREKLLTVKAAT